VRRAVVLGGAALGAIAIALSTIDLGWTLALSVARASGWIAAGALGLALSMSPIARIVRFVSPRHAVDADAIPLRRAFGIAAASFALVHAAVAIGGPLDGAWDAIATAPFLRAGLLALLVLAALLVTSFPSLVRKLRVRAWKPLHRLAYAAAALVFLHLVLSPFAPRATVLVVFGALATVALGRFLPRRKADRSATRAASHEDR
jgi:methionine sulfoxide reductase heme-binding subunit